MVFFLIKISYYEQHEVLQQREKETNISCLKLHAYPANILKSRPECPNILHRLLYEQKPNARQVQVIPRKA